MNFSHFQCGTSAPGAKLLVVAMKPCLVEPRESASDPERLSVSFPVGLFSTGKQT
jgi:hypothetical protein